MGGYLYDARRYARHACIGWVRLKMDRGQIEGRLMATYHVVEKGLSMPDFRPGFGTNIVKNLIKLVRQLDEEFGCRSNINLTSAKNVLRAYCERHAEIDFDLGKVFTAEEMSYLVGLERDQNALGGGVAHQRDSYFAAAEAPFGEFSRTRHSCRVFQPDRPPSLVEVEKAVELARFAPSVCNRQCWRAHYFDDKAKVEELLGFQGGNRGFGHTIPGVIVVTASLKVFAGFAERSQGHFDGGLFAMSLMHALHSQKIGSVPLCWLVTPKRDAQFRGVAEIPDDEVVLMFIGLGYPVDDFLAPASQRREVSEILTHHS